MCEIKESSAIIQKHDWQASSCWEAAGSGPDEGLLFKAGTQHNTQRGAGSYKSTIDPSAQQTAPHSTNDNVKKCFKLDQSSKWRGHGKLGRRDGVGAEWKRAERVDQVSMLIHWAVWRDDTEQERKRFMWEDETWSQRWISLVLSLNVYISLEAHATVNQLRKRKKANRHRYFFPLWLNAPFSRLTHPGLFVFFCFIRGHSCSYIYITFTFCPVTHSVTAAADSTRTCLSAPSLDSSL